MVIFSDKKSKPSSSKPSNSSSTTSPSSSSNYFGTKTNDPGYLANSEAYYPRSSPTTSSSSKKGFQFSDLFNWNNNTNNNNNSNNMGNAQTDARKHRASAMEDTKSAPKPNVSKQDRFRKYDQDNDEEDRAGEVWTTSNRRNSNNNMTNFDNLFNNINMTEQVPSKSMKKVSSNSRSKQTTAQFDNNFGQFLQQQSTGMGRRGSRGSTGGGIYSHASVVPQQQSTGYYNPIQQQQSTGLYSSNITALPNNDDFGGDYGQPIPAEEARNPPPIYQQQQSKTGPPPQLLQSSPINSSKKEKQSPSEKEKPQKKQQVPTLKRKTSVASQGSTGSLGYRDGSLSDADDDFDQAVPVSKEEGEDEQTESKQEPGSKSWRMDKYRSVPSFDTAFTTTRIYFKYGEYNLPATISDQSNWIQIVTEIKQKFKTLQGQDDSSIEISYDTNEISNILVLDDPSVLEMINYFKSIESPTQRIIKVTLNNTNTNNTNNNNNTTTTTTNTLNNNVNNSINNNETIFSCKFSAEYLTSTLEKATKNFVLKISLNDPLQKFVSDIADKCSLPNGSGLYTLQFYDKAFNDYIDINEMSEMDLDKQGINLIRIKKTTRRNTGGGGSGNQSGQSYTNAFIGLVINNRYVITDSLGRGGQGCVLGCDDLETNEKLAIKFIISNGDLNDEIQVQEENAKKEAIFMKMLDHENIAKVQGVYTWGEILQNSPDLNYNMLFTPLLCILMERYMYGNIMQTIIMERGLKFGPLPLKLVFQIIFQTSKALAFIHERQIIHRDIKPHNILVKSLNLETNDINIVLSDFGTAKDNIHTTHHTHIGTLLFESPEVMLHRSYGLSADLFSLGVTLFQLLSLNTTFNVSFKLIQSEKDCFNEMDQYISKNYANYNNELNYKDVILQSLIEILHKLMRLSPQDRYTSREVVEQLDILELEFS